MEREEVCYLFALGLLSHVGPVTARMLYQRLGSAKAVYDHRHDMADAVPDINRNLAKALATEWDAERKRADEELTFCEKKNIEVLCLPDKAYPARLRECDDAPMVLFYRGSADLNVRKVVNLVGTRRCTDYGADFCEHFIEELAELAPDVLVVSGLAYGIDIHAHRAALAAGLPTVGVLAHGLDRIYPYKHRNTAIKMLANGGLLTEFPSQTQPDRYNFISRNRIIAGMSDATIVVESAHKGGALVTANLADGYHRDVFAVPGRLTDEFSEGCNDLISRNKAVMLMDAHALAVAMNWEVGQKTTKPKEPELFPDLTDEEQQVVAILRKGDGMQINLLVIESGIPINKLNAMLFELEMKGVVKPLVGGVYKAI
jgi:DNA processing protein